MAPNTRLQRSVNKWAARIIPVILIGLVGFATWVIIVLIAVNYLIHPPPDVPVRRGAGIAIIVIYGVLLLLMASAYLRILQVVVTNPGLVPPPKDRKTSTKSDGTAHGRGISEKRSAGSTGTNDTTSQQADYLDRGAIYGGRQTAPTGLAQYYNRDVFECEVDGLPRWCSTCKSWKPDRTHHSSEVGRCVYKMDHFCPWAGGIVSETTYKFFVQFCVYGMLYCFFTLVVSAYYTAQWHNRTSLFHVTWIIVVALTALFLIFTFGMTWNSLLAVYYNTTTVDNLTRKTRIYHFAVLMPDWHSLVQFEQNKRVSADPIAALRQSPPPEAATPFSTIVYPFLDPSLPREVIQSQRARVFAILPTPIGANPYRLSSSYANFKAVFGNHWWDFFLPIRYSPCCSHLAHGLGSTDDKEPGERAALMYEFGPVLDDMKRDAGLLHQPGRTLETDRHGRRRLRDQQPPVKVTSQSPHLGT